MNNSLEPDIPEIRQLLEETTDSIVDFLSNIDKPYQFDADSSVEKALQHSETLPENKMDLKDLLEDLFHHKIENALPTAHPGFMAYIPGGGIFHAALAELIAKVSNRYIGIEVTAPYLSQIESDVIRWFCEMVGFDGEAGGTLTSGGSIANLTAVICARTLILGDDFSKGTVYVSEFVHHSMLKAFQAAGIPLSNIRSISVDEQFKLDPIQLEQVILDDIKQGKTPLMVVANAGSTNTGSIDPLDDISKVAQKFSAWFHVDAAYGGFFALTESGKIKLSGLELADSITLDPHKGLFLPYGTGAFIVKDREKLKRVFSHQADYIPDKTAGQQLWDFSEMSLELTRPFRGLGVWLPFKMLGANAFRQALNEKLELANYFYQQLAKNNHWKIVANPELSLTVFRYENAAFSVQQLNTINKKILLYVNQKGRVNISGTLINGYFVIRNCILSFRTHAHQVDQLLQDLEEGFLHTGV